MTPQAARPWRVVGVGAAHVHDRPVPGRRSSPGPEFDGFGVDDVLLLRSAPPRPLVTCALLARRVSRTRWPALVVDGAVITVALLVVTEVLRTPLVNPVGAPDDLRSLVLAYGGYAAVMLGGAGALCTVSTAALRRSVSVMIGAVAWQASAACFEAMAIISPSWVWTAGSDVSVALGLQTVVVAAALRADPVRRPQRPRRRPAGEPPGHGPGRRRHARACPLAIGLMELRDQRALPRRRGRLRRRLRA